MSEDQLRPVPSHSFDEPTRRMLELEQKITGRFTVAIVVGGDADSLFGSGTLVRFGDRGGIVTCSHVLHRLGKARKKPWGLVCFSVVEGRAQWWPLPEELAFLQLGEPPWESSEGPDIAFVGLPTHFMVGLEKLASVVNLDRHRALNQRDEPTSMSVDLVIGAVQERTTVEERRVHNERGVHEDRRVHLEALINACKVRGVADYDGYDVVTLMPKPDGTTPMPTGFGGTSGGGLWKLYFKRTGEHSAEFVERRFRGVAFYQTDSQPDTNLPDLVCHGPQSLYRQLLPKILSGEGMRSTPV